MIIECKCGRNEYDVCETFRLCNLYIRVTKFSQKYTTIRIMKKTFMAFPVSILLVYLQ